MCAGRPQSLHAIALFGEVAFFMVFLQRDANFLFVNLTNYNILLYTYI
jgi:hypothetical protein